MDNGNMSNIDKTLVEVGQHIVVLDTPLGTLKGKVSSVEDGDTGGELCHIKFMCESTASILGKELPVIIIVETDQTDKPTFLLEGKSFHKFISEIRTVYPLRFPQRAEVIQLYKLQRDAKTFLSDVERISFLKDKGFTLDARFWRENNIVLCRYNPWKE